MALYTVELINTRIYKTTIQVEANDETEARDIAFAKDVPEDLWTLTGIDVEPGNAYIKDDYVSKYNSLLIYELGKE